MPNPSFLSCFKPFYRKNLRLFFRSSQFFCNTFVFYKFIFYDEFLLNSFPIRLEVFTIANSFEQLEVQRKLSIVLIPLFLLIPVFISFSPWSSQTAGSFEKNEAKSINVVRIASKNFTEQHILAEMMAQMIEKRTHLTVDRTFNLGGTIICHEALKRGEIDLYAEYTGTGLMAILKLPAMNNPDEVYHRVSEEYLNRFNAIY